MSATLHLRLATTADLPLLRGLMARAIAELQKGFLDPAQIAASATMMGLDTRLIEDRTYIAASIGGTIVGCGGWSQRATLYGGDHSPGRDSNLLVPQKDAARIRAMYTNPDFARRGVGRAVLAACEAAARDAGFLRAELMATLSGRPLYLAAGYTPIKTILDSNGAVPVPLVHMGKDL